MIKGAKFLVKNYWYNLTHPGQKTVAVVSCDEWKNRVTDDRVLVEALNQNGLRAKIISWQDAKVNYEKIDALVIGSMWGYQNYLPELEKWFLKIADKKVINSLDVIRKNYDKVTQYELLKQNNIPINETLIIEKGDGNLEQRLNEFYKGCESFVVKPSVSGSGENTFLINNDSRKNSYDLTKIMLDLTKINKDRALLVQPFLKGIDDGECAMIYIGGEFSHAMMRYPHVFNDNGREHEIVADKIDAEVFEICGKVLNIPEYRDATYARIDLVKDGESYKVMEVEMFEPQLFYAKISNRDAALCKIVTQIKHQLEC